jgi:hypothetical protein
MLEIIKDSDVVMVGAIAFCVVIGSYLHHRQVNQATIAGAGKELHHEDA